MTFRALLDDGKVHKPILRMLTGEMTPKQIDKEYHLAVGKCPDCEGFLAKTDLGDGSTFAAAVAGKNRDVTYRKGHYLVGTDQLVTQMHFKHANGYLQNGLAPCNCKSKNQLIHTEAVEAIAHQYRKDSPDGFRVDAECQFIKPGTPPETYRPDIVVFNQFGGKHTCIEYQRSPEPFDKFVHRHELRGSEWGNVIWFFDKKIWERKSTCEARDWLFDNDQTFYLCWVDEATLQLQVEEGTFATAIVKEAQQRKLKKFVPRACSEADIIKEYLLATGQETDGRKERKRERQEPPKADRLQGFNLVKKSEADRKKQRELFETLKRQKAEQEEAERRRREYGAKMNMLDRIERVEYQTSILGKEGRSNASKHWTLEELEAELKRLQELEPKAQAKREQIAEQKRLKAERHSMVTAIVLYLKGANFWSVAEELSDAEIHALHEQAMEAKAKREAAAKAEREREEAEAREMLERQQAAARAKWERDNAERLERERQQREAERHWHPIKLSEPVRGRRMVLNLMTGEKIRRHRGAEAETYKERTAAGYTTDRHTYQSLDGWQVWKKATLPSD